MSPGEKKYSLFRHQIELRRFDDATLAILESILTSTVDVKSRLDMQSSLKEFLRSESLITIRNVADKSLMHKLLVLDFFVRAFAYVNDIESCLTLRYEALILRESAEVASSVSSQHLMTSVDEWNAFAQDSFDNDFYSVTAKACERALLHPGMCTDPEQNKRCVKGEEAVRKKIQNLSFAAMRSSSTHPVQVQSAEYLKRKTSTRSFKPHKEANYSASTSFRDGIKKRNVRRLRRFQKLTEVE